MYFIACKALVVFEEIYRLMSEQHKNLQLEPLWGVEMELKQFTGGPTKSLHFLITWI